MIVIGRHGLLTFAGVVLATAMLTPGRGEAGANVSSLVPGAAMPDLHPIVVIDRDDIVLSGTRNLWDFLASRKDFNAFGLHRPLSLDGSELYSIGGRRIDVMVNGRGIFSSSYDLDGIPVSSVERIEILRDSAVGPHGPKAIAGAVNIVLRNRFEGAEIQIGSERPVHSGGETEHASALWGGAWGDGHLTLGIDVFQRDEIRRSQRNYSQASWTPGGSFADASGVSIAGNTFFTFETGGPVAQSLGDCQDSEFTGPLLNPLGYPGEGCGFGWGNRQWSWERRDRQAAFAFFEHPVGADQTFYAEARLAVTDYAPLDMAPTPGQFYVPPAYSPALPNGGLLFHRFAGHGDRSWRDDTQEHELTLGLKGAFSSGIAYDVHLRSYYHDSDANAGTYIRESTFLEEIGPQGRYDLENPLSRDPNHLDAIRRIAVRLDNEENTKHRTAHIVFDGTGLELGGGAIRWAAGAEFVRESRQWSSIWRDGDGDIVEPIDVVGWSTLVSEGERDRLSEFIEITLPLRHNWDVVLAARHDDYDDVGSALSGQISTGYRLSRNLLLRGSWTEAEKGPFLEGLNVESLLLASRVYDPRLQSTYIVPSINRGNPNLGPDRAKNLGLGVEGTFGALTLSADWYRLKLSRILAVVSTQAIIDHAARHGSPPGDTVIHRHPVLQFITHVDQPVLGDGKAEFEGFNVRAQWDWETDWVSLGLDAHWSRLTEYEFLALGLKKPLDYPEDRGQASLRATWGNLTAQWSSYGISTHRTEDGRFGSWVGHDLSLRWEQAFGVRGADLVGGILNVDDREPAFNPGDPDYRDERLDSIRGRTLFLTLLKNW